MRFTVIFQQKGIESLKEYLQQEDVIRIINKHSDDCSNSSLCWNSIFQSCHNVLLQVTQQKIFYFEFNSIPTTASRYIYVIGC